MRYFQPSSNMKQSQRTVSVVLLATILALSIVPQGAMASTPTNVVSYGLEYDWSNLDGDVEEFTNLDLNEILGDVMDAATEAGFKLVLAEITTGATNMYVLSEEDHTAQTVNGVSGDVWSRTTDLTIRHGMLADSAMFTDWANTSVTNPVGFNIEASYDIENSFTTDALYVEYFDATSNELVGADLDLSINAGMGAELIVIAEIDGGGENLDINFAISASGDIGLDSSHTEWRLDTPSSLYATVVTNNETDWNCVETGSTDLWADVNDECGEMDGTYSASMNYAFDLSGIPTEELGMSAGEFDLSISDTLSNSGVFEITDDELADSGMYFEMSDSLSVELGDGDSTSVRYCNSCGPINPLMSWMMGQVIVASMSETLETFGEDIEEEVEDMGLEDIFGFAEEDNNGDPYDPYFDMYLCDNGNYVDDWQVNDDWDDCGDNSDEAVLRMYNSYVDYDSNSDVINFEGYFHGIGDNGFYCADGSRITFYLVNDGYANCNDGSDEPEYDTLGAETSTFECRDGSIIGTSQANDGIIDCPLGYDEGSPLDIEIILTDSTGTLIASAVEVISVDTTQVDFEYSGGLSSYSEICWHITGSNTLGDTLYSSEECEHIGMHVDNIDAYDADGLTVETWVWIQDTYGSTGYTVEISAMEVGSTTATDSVTHAIDGNDYDAHFEDNLAVTSEGDYVVVVDIYDDTGTLYSSETTEQFTVEEEMAPSQKMENIIDSFMNSNFESVLESFGQEMEQVIEDLDPTETLPYDDVRGGFLWSDDHLTIVGMGLYVHDETANEWQTMVGPTTVGMDNTPTIPVSINYVTGQTAVDGATAASGQLLLKDIVDASSHDTADLEETLIENGIDPADLGLGDEGPGQSSTPPTAEELAEEGGLLPFVSPAALLTVTILAGLIAAVRNRDEE